MDHSIVICRSVSELRARVAEWRRDGETIGLVPTMGALHEGHLTLVRRAQADNRRCIVTLFVNPTQFGPSEDLTAYPRNEAADRDKLAALGVDLLFAPGVAEMYAPDAATTVSVARLTEHLCGPFRPGHFAGVATIVTKLLLQSMPDAAYFGEKDYQQLQVIRRLARDLDIPVRIVGVPTVRDADGLALSSRNAYLAPDERAAALALPRTLEAIAERLAQSPKEVARQTAWGRDQLSAAGFTKIEYVEVCDAETLQPLDEAKGLARVFCAAWMGRTRLIDNAPIQP
ncbi:MAG: pantoate--beta-alanine ligase [Rhodospirillales bacterium]|nr:pantoate--beta-alanine ligase [Rhodospirillales bacterium]